MFHNSFSCFFVCDNFGQVQLKRVLCDFYLKSAATAHVCPFPHAERTSKLQHAWFCPRKASPTCCKSSSECQRMHSEVLGHGTPRETKGFDQKPQSHPWLPMACAKDPWPKKDTCRTCATPALGCCTLETE